MSPPSIVVLLLSHKKITLARLACLCFVIGAFVELLTVMICLNVFGCDVQQIYDVHTVLHQLW